MKRQHSVKLFWIGVAGNTGVPLQGNTVHWATRRDCLETKYTYCSRVCGRAHCHGYWPQHFILEFWSLWDRYHIFGKLLASFSVRTKQTVCTVANTNPDQIKSSGPVNTLCDCSPSVASFRRGKCERGMAEPGGVVAGGSSPGSCSGLREASPARSSWTGTYAWVARGRGRGPQVLRVLWLRQEAFYQVLISVQWMSDELFHWAFPFPRLLAPNCRWRSKPWLCLSWTDWKMCARISNVFCCADAFWAVILHMLSCVSFTSLALLFPWLLCRQWIHRKGAQLQMFAFCC